MMVYDDDHDVWLCMNMNWYQNHDNFFVVFDSDNLPTTSTDHVIICNISNLQEAQLDNTGSVWSEEAMRVQ